MRRSAEALRVLVLIPALACGALLAGCSDIYYDRRETISFHAGDAPAANKVSQTIDPWPAAAGNRHIEGNGERIQRAIERYRTNKTTPLMTTGTSSVQYTPVMAPAAPAAAGPSP
jgi:hypothetical protein